MKIGFTGTRDGMSSQQLSEFWEIIRIRGSAQGFSFHHGCCLGADSSAVDVVDRLWPADIQAYPSDIEGMTSENAILLSKVVHPPSPPLQRNHAIVDACDLLIACPKGPEEQRSGTWATVRYARRLRKPIIILWPSGAFTQTRERCEKLEESK